MVGFLVDEGPKVELPGFVDEVHLLGRQVLEARVRQPRIVGSYKLRENHPYVKKPEDNQRGNRNLVAQELPLDELPDQARQADHREQKTEQRSARTSEERVLERIVALDKMLQQMV